MLFQQVQITTAATPGSSVWVYRCSVYAYPWFTSVRTILDDPACALSARAAWADRGARRSPRPSTPSRTPLRPPRADSSWFLKFKPQGPWYSPKCDNNFSPPKCSDNYHNQEQTCAHSAARHAAASAAAANAHNAAPARCVQLPVRP